MHSVVAIEDAVRVENDVGASAEIPVPSRTVLVEVFLLQCPLVTPQKPISQLGTLPAGIAIL